MLPRCQTKLIKERPHRPSQDKTRCAIAGHISKNRDTFDGYHRTKTRGGEKRKGGIAHMKEIKLPGVSQAARGMLSCQGYAKLPGVCQATRGKPSSQAVRGWASRRLSGRMKASGQQAKLVGSRRE